MSGKQSLSARLTAAVQYRAMVAPNLKSSNFLSYNNNKTIANYSRATKSLSGAIKREEQSTDSADNCLGW